MEATEFVVVVMMVGVNAVFAAYEIGLASITVARLQFLVSQGRRGAASALYMKQEIEKSLAVVQLGITLVGLIAGATGGASATDDIAPVFLKAGLSVSLANILAIALVVIPLTVVTIVIGELVPKLFALRYKEWVCLTFSPFLKWFTYSVWPIVWMLETSASGIMDTLEKFWRPNAQSDSRMEAVELQELRAIASLARTSRLIGAREENIILGAARLASRPLREILLPAEHICMMEADRSVGDSLVAAHLDMHTRFPVSERADDPQSIIGYVTFKDIVAILRMSPGATSLRGIVRRLPEFNEGIPISEALERLLREHSHIALVRNEQGRISGMITLEDIVEEMVGDIQDEYDLLPTHVVKTGDGWIIGGGATLSKVQETTDLQFPGSDLSHNVNHWMTDQIGHSPDGGEIVANGGVHAVVRKVRRQKVLEALLRQK